MARWTLRNRHFNVVSRPASDGCREGRACRVEAGSVDFGSVGLRWAPF
ncbi:hypothetical protein GEM_0152 [Burkholderia cepacia GG4]|uniref:Uncharacterized protein n=1 Tax=Burkholderia cepacia GG4 TaxID=1009846 RepID=A0A9W3K0T5_BURCE|nr:hypothetical protein GEM_0152 [Burkholderia cepacia GG4]